MLIESYDLKVEVSNHSVEEFEYEAIAHLTTDISAALPYLNRELKSGIYLPNNPVLSWRKDINKISFWSDRIAVDNLESRERAEEIIEELVQLVNDVWDRREQIEPDTKTYENLQPLELFRLLPKTNCKECGESSCFNFALKLAAGQQALAQCGPLCTQEEYKEQLGSIESMMAERRTLL